MQSGKLPRGVLDPEEARNYFALRRVYPSGSVGYFVEHYWSVQWALPANTSYTQEILSYPSVHFVFEPRNTLIYGVVTGTFARRLEGSGHVLGIKFRPGAFYPFLRYPVWEISDITISPAAVFPVEIDPVEREVLAAETPEEMAARAEHFLQEHLPQRDPRVGTINNIVETIIEDRSILSVDQLTGLFDMSKRTLQRLFRTYVGVSPKWIVKRFRLHEAAAVLADGEVTDWTHLAVELGYFDQAHFINDFRSVVGVAPAQYVKQVGWR